MKLDSIFNKNKVKIIAEIGINHNGVLSDAEKMIEEASDAGADAVKFQTFNPESLYSEYTKSLLENSDQLVPNREIIDFFNKFTFNEKEWIALKNKAEMMKIEFFSAPFDCESVDLLEKIGVRLYKIASSEVTNIPLIEKVVSTCKPVLMSTGMCDLNEIRYAVDLFRNNNLDFALLHCVSLYPTDENQINLERIAGLKTAFDCKTGFSDHSPEIKYAAYSVFFGAEYIEKHFTMENYDAPDNCVSIDKEKIKKLRNKINKNLVVRGNGKIDSLKNQEIVAISARRSLFANRDINSGEKVDMSDFVVMRPGVGIDPLSFKISVNKELKKEIKKGEPLKDFHIKEA